MPLAEVAVVAATAIRTSPIWPDGLTKVLVSAVVDLPQARVKRPDRSVQATVQLGQNGHFLAAFGRQGISQHPARARAAASDADGARGRADQIQGDVEGVQRAPDALADGLLVGARASYGRTPAPAVPTVSSPPTSSQIWRFRVSGMKNHPTTAVISATAMV